MFLESKLVKFTIDSDVDTRSLLAISVSDTFSVRSYATFCRTRLEIWQFFSTIDVLATVTLLQLLHWKRRFLRRNSVGVPTCSRRGILEGFESHI